MPVLGLDLTAPADLAHLLEPYAATEARRRSRCATRSAPPRGPSSTPRARTWRATTCGLGLEPGDRVASLMPNRVSLLAHYLACFRSGLVVTPLNYRYAAPEIDHALEVSGAALLVAHAERSRRRSPRSARVGDVRLGVARRRRATARARSSAAHRRRRHPTSTSRPAAPTSPAAIFFTSGSTGPAKGVTHSLETLGWMTAAAAAAFELTADDRFLPASSMSHIGSFLWTLATLSVGAQAVIAHTFDAGERAAAAARAPTDGPRDDPRRAHRARPRPRRHRRRLLVAAPLPLRRRQGVGRARGASSPRSPGSRSTRATA